MVLIDQGCLDQLFSLTFYTPLQRQNYVLLIYL